MALTQEMLRMLIVYDPATGEMRWGAKSRGRAKAGALAGSLCKQDGYRLVMVLGKMCRQHRLAWLYMTGAMPSGEIDHINGDRSDNRWVNLRDVSHSVNQQNLRSPRRGRKHDLPAGVELAGEWMRKIDKPYCVRVRVDGRRQLIGYFSDKHEAAVAAVMARRSLYPGFTL